MNCPRCSGEVVNKDSDVLDDPEYGMVIFRKSTCPACGFFTVNIAWLNKEEEVEYCGWTQDDDCPPHVPEIVKQRMRMVS